MQSSNFILPRWIRYCRSKKHMAWLVALDIFFFFLLLGIYYLLSLHFKKQKFQNWEFALSPFIILLKWDGKQELVKRDLPHYSITAVPGTIRILFWSLFLWGPSMGDYQNTLPLLILLCECSLFVIMNKNTWFIPALQFLFISLL